MDPDELREETRAWVADGIISSEQAEAIRDRYDESDEGLSRAVIALSLMGATLFGVGAVMFLAINWEDIPRWLGTLIVIAAPLAFGGSGLWLLRGRAPRVGHALWLLGAAFVGPSLFLLVDLWTLETDPEWLLLGWTAVATPAGHVIRSRPTTGLGLVVMTAIVAVVSDTIVVAVGLFGVTILGIGLYHRRGAWAAPDLGVVYRFIGAGTVIAALLATVIGGAGPGWVPVYTTPLLVVLLFGASVSVAAIAWLARGEALEPSAALWQGTAAAAMVGASVVAWGGPTISEIGALLLVHAALLALLFATVVAAMGLRSTSLVNLAVVAFLLQVLVFLTTTLPDNLPTEAVLIVTGLVLLACGLVLERGRRQVLERMGERESEELV